MSSRKNDRHDDGRRLHQGHGRCHASARTPTTKKGLSRGKLRVAVLSTAKYFMPSIIGSFCKRYPAIDVSLEILNRDGVVQRLRNNLDDLYIMPMPPSDMDVTDEAFMPNPIVVIAPMSAWSRELVWCHAIAWMDFKRSMGSALWMSKALPCHQLGTSHRPSGRQEDFSSCHGVQTTFTH